MKIYIPSDILRQCQLRSLEILKQIDKICKAHDIKYFLSCGTLLGAVRHKGFIPWDDDIDICMMPEDYAMFRNVVEREIDNEKFFVSTLKTNPKNPFNWLQIYDKETTFILKGMEESDEFYQAIGLDIFPLKFVSNIFQNKLIFKLSRLVVKTSYIDPKKGTSKAKRFIKSLICFVGLKKFCNFLYDLMLRNYKGESQTLWYNINATIIPGFHNELDIFPLKKISFEGEEFYAPCNTDAVLKNLYGNDYMMLPPEEKRKRHASTIKINERCLYQKKLDLKLC